MFVFLSLWVVLLVVELRDWDMLGLLKRIVVGWINFLLYGWCVLKGVCFMYFVGLWW